MPLSWNEIKSRALSFSRAWADATDENSHAKPFWLAFFETFGITDKRVADLYDPLTMPPALLKAHQKLDTAVDKAYEACGGKKTYKNDAGREAFLFDLYQRQTPLLAVGKVAKSKKTLHAAPAT